MKQGPQWIPGIWVGKTNEDDLHLVIGVGGVMRGKAVRRTSEPWRPTYLFLVKDKPFRNPGIKRPPLRIMPSTPMVPRGVRGPGRPKKQKDGETAEAGEEKDFPRDRDADDVEQYAREHGGTESPGEEDERGTKRGASGSTEESRGEKYLRVPPMPMGLDDVGERAPQTPEVKRPKIPSGEDMMADDGDPQEPPTKIAKSSVDTSPKQLYPPHYAGNVNQASFPVDDEAWEKDVEEFGDEDGNPFPIEVENADEGCPPELDEEELMLVEEEAGQEEIQRLLQMGVLRDPTPEELEEGTVLTTRSVYDWRFRENKWKRRCRFVAREFRAGDCSNAQTFAPTSSLSATRLLMASHTLLNWKLTFIDVKDAFLLVDQVKLVLVEKPLWWKPEELEMMAKGQKFQ